MLDRTITWSAIGQQRNIRRIPTQKFLGHTKLMPANFQSGLKMKSVSRRQLCPSGKQELVIRASIFKMFWLVALLGAFTFLAIFCIFIGPSFWGWVGTVVLVPLFMLSLYVYRPGATYLRLTAEGVEIANMGRLFKMKWTDVEGFHLGTNRGDSQIGILFTEAYLEKNSARFIQDPDRAWIRDLYTVSSSSLCEILNQCRSSSQLEQSIEIDMGSSH